MFARWLPARKREEGPLFSVYLKHPLCGTGAPAAPDRGTGRSPNVLLLRPARGLALLSGAICGIWGLVRQNLNSFPRALPRTGLSTVNTCRPRAHWHFGCLLFFAFSIALEAGSSAPICRLHSASDWVSCVPGRQMADFRLSGPVARRSPRAHHDAFPKCLIVQPCAGRSAFDFPFQLCKRSSASKVVFVSPRLISGRLNCLSYSWRASSPAPSNRVRSSLGLWGFTCGQQDSYG